MIRMSKEVSAMRVLGQMSLRGARRATKQSRPGTHAQVKRDCFASLAMTTAGACPCSHQHRGRALEILPDGADEDGAERAVDRAVIARQRDLHLRRHRDPAVLDDGALLAAADRLNGRLRRVDDG